MPELPEVETIVRELNRAVSGRILRCVFVFDKRLGRPKIKLPQKIRGAFRRGKYIILEFMGGGRLVFHLRMTGELLLEKNAVAKGEKKHKHQRASLCFSGGLCARFFDVRRFGTLDFYENGKELPGLGVEPFSNVFSAKTLLKTLAKSGRPIKNFLLDQKNIAGIGNIYADESLWLSKINPLRKANDLSVEEAGNLVISIKKVLREAIKKGGFTLRDYRRLDGSSGYYQHSRKVYGREGEQCRRCGVKIKRIKLGGRSSYFCTQCQK